jgi:hypothetical protein
MGKHNTLSGVLVLVVILMIGISTFVVLDYTTGVITNALAFASSDQIAKIQACGITLPAQFFKLQYDIPNLLLPAIYVGFPALMIILSILMFIAGYYHSGKEGHSSIETTTTTSSPNRRESGRYAPGRRVEQTRTQKSSKTEDD